MKACFINLDTAVARRSQVEASFAAVPHDGWTLHRFSAVTAGVMADAPGPLLPTEKACFESHRRLIGQHLADQAPLYVLEDDVTFSRLTFPFLSAMADARGEWDLLFTDLVFLQLGHMIEGARAWERLAPTGQVQLTPLQGSGFIGAAAYLVRGSSKEKLHALLADAPLDQPYDVALRELVAAGRLKVAVSLPFLTTLSRQASESQIGAGDSLQIRAFDEFRRLMFVERDMAALRPAVEAIGGELPEADRMAGLLLAAASLAR